MPFVHASNVTMDQPLFRVTVARKRTEALAIQTFELVHSAALPLPSFTAGAHIDVRTPTGVVRQYSLCNDSQETHRYLIAVLRDPMSRGGSVAIHEHLQEGDSLLISAPRNRFPLEPNAKRSLLFAGGIGITPIICMADELARIGAQFEVQYFARTPQRTAFINRIEQSPFADRVSFHFEDSSNAHQCETRRVLASPDPDTHLYVCGPEGFMQFITLNAKECGWEESNIHQEHFGRAVVAQESDRAFEVVIASSGRVYTVPPGQTIVETLAKAGIQIPIACEQGVCGTCMTRVLEGEPDHRDALLTPAERARNDQFTPCCSRAKSARLVLDL